MTRILTPTLLLVLLSGMASACFAASPSFADFDRRAKRGERLTVVFFGASLTWGANATDQTNTSYRARVAEHLDQTYPKAHFKYYDAAIGGTGSQLGVFRLDRDVLRRKPNLVFLDFSANDGIGSADPETMASYESLIRRIIVEAHAPVVQVIFPFGWDVAWGDLNAMGRRIAHLELSTLYRTAAGDAIALCKDLVARKVTTVDAIWPNDKVHPGDAGYQIFADTAWQAYQTAVKQKLVCVAPEKMRYADTYLRPARVRISTLYGKDALPKGWYLGTPNLTAAWHDGLMSRWLDDELIATNKVKTKNAEGKEEVVTVTPERLKARFTGSMLLLFGEKTVKSAKYHVYIDGKLMTYTPWGAKAPVAEYSASAANFGGNVQLAEVIATGLDPTVEHTVEIEPVFTGDAEQELRLESICVAGGQAKVLPAAGQ